MDSITQNDKSDVLQSMLKESTDRFLTEYRKGATDFSNFATICSRFLQNLPDPPLEIIWFYSALASHSAKLTAQKSSNHVFVAKDSFQLLVSCSCSCNAVKKIAVLAPVIYELHSLVSEGKRWTNEIDSFLEVIVSYISICSGANFDENEEFGALSSCLVDLVRVWLVENVGESCKFGEELRVFFPLVSDGIIKRIVSEGCGIGYLAGIVMTEAFLLRSCLKFRLGISWTELEKELRGWAVEMITAFRNYYFVDALLKMLLEPTLSVSTILNSEDEVFLRNILYDTAMTVDYSFLGPQKGIHLPDLCLKNLAITWLFVADNAIQFLRDNGNQSKVLSCLIAFSASCLPSQLIKWVTCQPGIESETSKPKVSTPLALINWLLTLEDQGVRVFDSDTSKMYAKTAIGKSKIEHGLSIRPEGKNLIESHFSHCSNEVKTDDKVDGDLEMLDSEGAMLLAAPRLLKAVETYGTRKRKDGRKDEEDKQVKFVKCNINDNLVAEKVSPLEYDDALNSGSEVDNPVSDEATEYMEQ
ncbi:hypothetical protein JCGZ_07684 [Jatropha curcas]|uniref:Uncharacterized protein n=1 Tax=Jatropha curcas TaxID=180498 RepID=A0A067KGH8_JATCU|nr:uncharacterized protein LOC105638164 [Jatropha curcas]KDP34113.1 hypothetical protein JCGZ_07684 [Jatropha curcas]